MVLPEFDRMMECPQNTPYHMYNVGEHTIKVMENVPDTKVMRWAALLHDVGKPDSMTMDKKDNNLVHFYGHAKVGSLMVPEIMKRLKMDNKTIKLVIRLVECHDDRTASGEMSPASVRWSVHKIGKDIYEQYLQLAYADFQGKSDYGRKKGFDKYLYTCQQFKYIMDNNICTCKAEMAVSGKDLIEIGCPKGEIIGTVLDELLAKVLDNPQLNERETLLNIASKMF